MTSGIKLTKKPWGLLLGSVIIALFAGEVYLRLNPTPLIYMRMRNIVQQTHSEPSNNPILGYVPKANLKKRFKNLEFDTEIEINSKNMRDKEYGVKKPEGMKRIIMIGDSMVFGWGVEAAERHSDLLENGILKNVEVLNFGVSGYRQNQSLELLRTEAIKYHPDIVFFFTWGLPFSHNKNYEFQNKKLYEQRPKALWRKLRNIFYRNAALYTIFEETYRNLAWKSRWERKKSSDTNAKVGLDEDEVRESLSLLNDFKELAESQSFKPVVVYFPQSYELKHAYSPTVDRENTILLHWCVESGVDCLDLAPGLKNFWKETEKWPYFKHDDHWNHHGHEAVAQVIFAYLKENALLEETFFAN